MLVSLYSQRSPLYSESYCKVFTVFYNYSNTIFFRDSMLLFSSFLMVAVGNPRKHGIILHSKAKLIFVHIRVVSYLRFDSTFN